MLNKFSMKNMDGYILSYRQGEYDGKPIGQIVIGVEKIEYKLEHFVEGKDGNFSKDNEEILYVCPREEILIEAPEKEEFEFDGWYDGDELISNDPSYKLIVGSERRFGYQLHLLNEVCKENDIAQNEVVHKEIAIDDYMDGDKLIEKGLLKRKK